MVDWRRRRGDVSRERYKVITIPAIDTQAEQRMSRIRSTLLLDHPWFGALALRLKLEQRASKPDESGFATDGTHYFYDPAKLHEFTDSELTFISAHEVLHCALLHVYRCAGRTMPEWNDACDYAINQLLVNSKVGTMPKGALLDNTYTDMSAEQIYSLRATRQQQPSPSTGSQAGQAPSAQPANPLAGDVLPASQPGSTPQQGAGTPDAQQPMSASDWQTAAEQAAMVARKAGRMSSNADRAIAKARTPRTDVVAELRAFLEQTTPSDYSWATPNRRHISNGLYLPGVTKENTPPFVFAIDTSGSVNEAMLNRFGAVLTEVLTELNPRELHVIYCDSQVRHTQTFTPDDGAVKLKAYGGGGTAFTPVFQHIKQDPTTYDEVAALVYLTDLLGSDNETVKEHAPPFPVLWVAPVHCRRPAPFGTLIVGDI